MGYDRAGFDVIGVDIEPQPSYPFEFVHGDAIEYLERHGREFDAIHASPPCQRYSVARHIHQSGNRHPDLISPCRDELRQTGRPWIMENVRGAPMQSAILLCGLMFGLRVLRHRLFESSLVLLAPDHPRRPKGNLTNSCLGYSTGREGFVCVAGHNFVREAGARAMGIDWMKSRHELAQAIPPAYTEFIGRQLLRVLTCD